MQDSIKSKITNLRNKDRAEINQFHFEILYLCAHDIISDEKRYEY